MTERKKLLLVATRQFWPITCGRSYTLYHYCRILYEQYGYDVYVFCFADKSTQKDRELPSFLNTVKYADIPGLKKSWKTVLGRSLVQKRYPIQASMMYDRCIQDVLTRYAEDIHPDVLMVDMIRLLPYADSLMHLSCIKIFLEDDRLQKRYRRQQESNHAESLAGNYSQNLPPFINRLSNGKWVRNMVLRLEIRLLESYEKHGLELFDYIGFVSPVETKEYNAEYQTDKGITLVVGTDIDANRKKPEKKDGARSMVIVGDFGNAANATSIRWICHDILPLLPEEVQYYVIGRFPDHLAKEINNDQVKIMGYVDDLRHSVQATDIYFAPLAFGTGIKTKIIEAMAMGMPVITNSVGAEGLEVTSGKQLIIADTSKELAECAATLLNDGALRQEIAQNGLEFVGEKHSWDQLCDAFDQMGL